MSDKKKLTTNAGCPVVDNQNVMTAGPRGAQLLQDVWFLEKLAHFDREVIPERRMHAKGSGAYGTFTITHDITNYTRAKVFSQPGNLFRLMTPTQQQVLFENTARSVGDAPREIQLRHIGNCMKADPAYGGGIAKALGIQLSEVS